MSEATSYHPLDQFFEAVEAEVFVDGVLDRLLTSVADTLYDHYLDSKNDAFIVKQINSTLVNVLEIEYTRRDTGETQPWAEDAEPPPCSIDTWGRGAIPVRKKYRVVHAAVPATAQREGSSRSMISSITRASQAFKSKIHQRPGAGPAVNEERSRTPVPLPYHKEQSTAEEATLRQKKEVETQRKAEEQERIRKEVEAEAERIKELVKRAHELRNKPFTYDYEGRIMMLRPTRDTDAGNATEFNLMTEDPPKTANKKGIERVASGKDLPVLKHKRPPVKEVEFIKNLQSVQPPLFEYIQLAPGVRMGEGSRVKANPLRLRHTTISRTQYRKMTEVPELLVAESSVSSSGRFHPHEGQGAKEAKKAKESSLKPAVVTPNPEMLSAIPDNEDESMQDSYKPRPSPPKTKSAMSMAPITQFGGEMEEAEGLSEVDQFNFQILRSKNWGMNPPVKEPNVPSLPKFSSLKTLHETYGHRSKLPRERPFIESQTSRKHLPPPPLGKTMGHGLLSGVQGSLTERSARSRTNK
jgi:hypothetical protein